jgi:outer membrane protein TolC
MKIKNQYLIVLGMLCSSTSFAITLQEAIQTAFDKNPITHANDLRLDAAKDRAQGAKLDMLPSGSLIYSQGRSTYDSNLNGLHTSGESSGRGWSVGASVNLFRGGADLNRARAAQKDVETLEATNNSTNALIPDTKGSLANSVFDVYTSLAFNIDAYSFLEQRRKNLDILLAAAKTEDQKNEIKTAIAGTDNSLFTMKRGVDSLILDYEYLVKMPFPGKIDKFDEISTSLTLPETSDDAIKIALAKSPKIIIAETALESSKLNKKAQIADAFSPRIDLSVSRGQEIYGGSGAPSRSIGNSVNVTLSLPLGASQYAYTAATRKEVEAREEDLNKEYGNLKHDIQDYLYIKLADLTDYRTRYLKTLEDTTAQVVQQLEKAQNHQSVDTRYVLSIMNSQDNQFFTFLDNENTLVATKFTIQREIGTLFETIKGRAVVQGIEK